MKKLFSDCGVLRISSLLSLLFFPSLSVIAFSGFDPFHFSVSVFAADAVFLMYPLPSQDVRTSFLFSSVYAIAVSSCFFLALPANVVLASSCLYIVTYLTWRCVCRFRRTRSLFCTNNVITFVREFSHLFYVTLLLAVTAILSSFPESRFISVACTFVFLLLFLLLSIRAYSMRTLFISPGQERQINEIARGAVRSVPSEHFVEDTRMASIYKQIVEVMEEKKPYLDPAFSIYDLSQIIFTNKTYVSRIINIYSGRNFCQFINYYRVKHASELIASDSALRVTELALMSGFNSSVTFNAAFRTFLGYSPGEYIQKVSSENLLKEKKD